MYRFFAPGPDYEIVKELGLASSVERYHIGFMGCYAAFQPYVWQRHFAIKILRL